ncbi:hypothetical protein ABBQ32_009998 [Trebouxia sp. C0010 RCD-2024]
MSVKPRPVPDTPPRSWSTWDRTVSTKLYHYVSHKVPRKYMILLEHSGNGLVWLSGAVGAWLYPYTTHQQRCAIANFLLAFVLDLLLVGTLKSILQRPRPIYNSSGDFILVVSVDQYSFPSGHASRAFYVAAFACVYLRQWSLWLCLLVVIWGITTAASRAAMGRHYVGDVCAGIPLGLFTVAIVTQGHFRPDSMLLNAQHLQQFHDAVNKLWLRSSTLGRAM